MKKRTGKKAASFALGILFTALLPHVSFAELSVIKVEVDWVPQDEGSEKGPMRDYYINGGEADGIKNSMIFDVFRRKSVPDAKTGETREISIPVGGIQVIRLSQNVAATRIISLTTPAEAPLLEYRTVLVGDYLVPRVPLSPVAVKKAPVNKTEKAQNISLSSELLFDFDKWDLKPEAEMAISMAYERFRNTKNKGIIVAGYTCSRGSDSHNLELSKRRAQSVADYLAGAKNIDPKNITIQYFGSKSPVSSNDTEEGRKKNRRVEISFVSSD